MSTSLNVILIQLAPLTALDRPFLRSYGNDWADTPNLTAFAEKGAILDNHFTGSLPCMPAGKQIEDWEQRKVTQQRSTPHDDLRAAGKYLITHHLTWGNAGNLSARTGENRALITASGTQMGNLEYDDLIELTFGEPTAPVGRKPSKETPMHQAVYETRPEIGAVLHAAPFYATLVACTALPVPSDWFVEGMYYLERVARVPYCHPGSPALGEAVRAVASEANVLLLDNHGVLVYDTSITEALMALHTLELTCRMAITARSAQLPVHPLDRNTVTDFLHNSGYRPRRQWPEQATENGN